MPENTGSPPSTVAALWRTSRGDDKKERISTFYGLSKFKRCARTAKVNSRFLAKLAENAKNSIGVINPREIPTFFGAIRIAHREPPDEAVPGAPDSDTPPPKALAGC